MKDEHLTTALHKALTRYGTSELPEDAHVEGVTRPPRRPSLGESLRRKPGWVTVSEIEASQSPNTYPRLTRRAIKARCKELASEGGTPVVEVRTVGLRSWVRVGAPSPSAREDVDGLRRGFDPDDIIDVGQPDLGGVGDVDEPAALPFDVDLDLTDRA